jgi:glycosyltransferase involved in cell wall biosynthesis
MTNVVLLGRIPREQVPAFLVGMDVCLLPFRVNSLTAAVSPLKLFEYFAAGKPVVSTRLEEVQHFAPLAAVADSKREFLQAIERFLAADDRQSDRRRLVAQRHSWSVLLRRLEAIVARSVSTTRPT